MTDTKHSTDKLNKSPTKPKLVTGSIGYYKGIWAEVKTTRCFYPFATNTARQRGVELVIDMPYQEAKQLEFIHCYTLGRYPEEKTVVFIDIVDFRKNFIYSETASLIYAK